MQQPVYYSGVMMYGNDVAMQPSPVAAPAPAKIVQSIPEPPVHSDSSSTGDSGKKNADGSLLKLALAVIIALLIAVIILTAVVLGKVDGKDDSLATTCTCSASDMTVTVADEGLKAAVADLQHQTAKLGNDEFRYDAPGGYVRKTNSFMPFMPMKDGWFQTHQTYRFLSVREQVLTVIGEAKHGLWRIQDNGIVRLYRKGPLASTGIAMDRAADPSVLTAQDLVDYAAVIPKAETPNGDGWSGWRYAQDADGDGKAAFVDVPIDHQVFEGKYDDHPPIDLPHFFCTMSGAEFPDAQEAWSYATAQPNANKVGPLGRRAGLDISEHYTKVVRFEMFADAKIWVNVGSADEERSVFDQADIDSDTWEMDVAYRALDTSKVATEVYLVERPFFNVPYLFVTVVMDHAENDDLSYVRPDGPYWESLSGATKASLKTTVTLEPRVPVLEFDGETPAGTFPMRATPFYGLNHLNRPYDDGGGGWCPQRGGDWGSYPSNPGGSGFQNEYEEITPLCDAVVVDIKMWANLDQPTWNSPLFQLQNAGLQTDTVTFLGEGNRYGEFTDPYLVGAQIQNPQALLFTPEDNPSPKPKQAIDVTYTDGVGVASRYVDPASGATVGGGGLTPAEKALRDVQTAEATNRD